jgi:2-amino-4-hydroxy-6-hydroxymethyldihydropteridine diphosphokinase
MGSFRDILPFPMESTPDTKIFLSLGSNLGDREKNLRDAIAAMAATGVRVVRTSSIYETEPVDFAEQPWFLNCVIEAQTTLAPRDLLLALRGIESRMGSKKEFAKGPRLLDIDILLYGEATIDKSELLVPHPRMTQRRFVLAPLAELLPQLRHPSWNGTAAELLAQLRDRDVVRLFRTSS